MRPRRRRSASSRIGDGTGLPQLGFWRLGLAIPGLVSLVLVLLGSLPIGVPFLGPVLPAFGLIAVHVFALQRPDLMPHWLAFALGLVTDLLSGGPLGLTALVFLGVQALSASQRRVLIGRPFVLGWAAFVAVALAAAGVSWLIACVYFLDFVNPAAALLQVAVTVTLFPLVAAPLLLLSHRMTGQAFA